MTALDIMPDASEVIHYDRSGIPLYIRKAALSGYPDMKALCHWHEDFEFIRVSEGEMNYSINGQTVLLKRNDCLFVNSKVMHYGYSNKKRECVFLCILIHPTLTINNSLLYSDYMVGLQNGAPFIKITGSKGDADAGVFNEMLDHIYELKANDMPAYELEVIGLLTGLIASTYRLCGINDTADRPVDDHLDAYKTMVSFISQSFADDISLDDIAHSASVSKSTCIRMFKEYSGQSPYDFLINYRLQVACNYLAESERSVTEISGVCGFNNASYFSKVFLERYGCQPHRYRETKRRG